MRTSKATVVGLAAAFGLGVVLAGQSRINGELGHRWADGILAALWSFGSGLGILLVLCALLPGMRTGARRVAAAITRGGRPAGDQSGEPASVRRLRWWQCLGGSCGAFVVLMQATTVPALGVAVFTVAVVAGQAASSLAVDRAGVGPAGKQAITRRRVVGAVLALAAVVLAVSDDLAAPSVLVLALLPALGGVGTAWQQAVNGRVGLAATLPPPRTDDPARSSGAAGAGHDSGTRVALAPPSSPREVSGAMGALTAALVNFSVGTVVLALAALVDVALRGHPDFWPAEPVLYLGGLCGVAFISAAALIVRFTGVLLLSLGSVAGQLGGALLLDAFVPAPGAELNAVTILGTALTLVAVLIAVSPSDLRVKPKRAIRAEV